MDRTFVALGALFGLLAVAAGAFGAHGLRERLAPADLGLLETAARYQMYHALALLFVGWAAGRWPESLWGAGGWLFVAGTVAFSGSLYLLALTGARWPGVVTPIGGACFLAGWACVALAALKGGVGSR